MGGNFHENLSRARAVKIGSNRTFGLVMGAACLVIAGFGLWSGSTYWQLWALGAIGFVSAALLWPAILYPLNRAWFWLGLALHRVVNPLVMGVIFFLVITPIGVLMRLCGKRPLGLEFQGGANSYWVSRDQSASQPGAMGKQY